MRFLFVVFVLTLIAGLTYGQQEKFTGIVVDSATFSPMPFVSIKVKHSLRGTSTDAQGNFSLIANFSDSIVISFVGYQSLELALKDWEPGLIRLSEKSVVLNTVTVQAKSIHPYEGMFDDQNAAIEARKLRFYYTKAKKQKFKLAWLKEDNLRVQTYVDVVINNPDIKNNLMAKHQLTEKEYYDVLTRFNETNYSVMYYLTAGELVSLINQYFEKHAPHK